MGSGRKFYMGGGSKVLIFACEIFGHNYLIEVQRSLMALDDATAV